MFFMDKLIEDLLTISCDIKIEIQEIKENIEEVEDKKAINFVDNPRS